MTFASLDAYIAASRPALAKGPVAIVVAEDGVELDTTLRHHLDAGFGTIVLLADGALNCFCDLEDGTNIAFKYYRMAAEKGNAYGLRQMGYIYRYLGKDRDEAAIYYKAAADKGDVESQMELGDLYRDGVGGAATLSLSPKYFLMAAAQGDARGYSRMAGMYADGDLVKANPSKAYIAQSIAAALNFPLAKEEAAEAAKKLNAKQLIKANVLIAKCAKAKYLKCL